MVVSVLRPPELSWSVWHTHFPGADCRRRHSAGRNGIYRQELDVRAGVVHLPGRVDGKCLRQIATLGVADTQTRRYVLPANLPERGPERFPAARDHLHSGKDNRPRHFRHRIGLQVPLE